MKKRNSRFLSSALAAAMVFNSGVTNVFAMETPILMEEEVESTDLQFVVEENLGTFTVKAEDITVEDILSNSNVATANVEDIEVNKDDPVISTVEDELDDMVVMTDEGKQSLTEEQKEQILQMYASYKQFWEENANLLGVQQPFYLSYNDNGEDGLGVLGEMLVLANVSVDDVRNGNFSYDDLTGMMLNFIYGDQLGLKYYGEAIAAKAQEALQVIEKSGAKTEIQKQLVLNDWLGQINTFDIGYIMNAGKDEPSMQAENPQKHEHYDEIYQTIYEQYEPQIREQFRSQIEAAVISNLETQFYENAIPQMLTQIIYQGIMSQTDMSEEEAMAQAQSKADEIWEKDHDIIMEDPIGYFETNYGSEAAAALQQERDNFIEKARTEGVEVAEGVTMTVDQMVDQTMENEKIVDLNGDGENDMTANEAIPIYADQAASGLTEGIIGYWGGGHIGALAAGTSVCKGYAAAYSYLLQVMHPEVYGVKSGLTSADMLSSADNWKTADELYYTNGELDTTKDYLVDTVRITFDADVSMYGEVQPNFNSDHFWNAVKVDSQWYYVDPCYTDVYTEVMARDRVETDGYNNHLYFMFSDDSARKMYDGYYSELKSLYSDVANDKTYEQAWFSRAKSIIQSDGNNMYYLYDSTDLMSMVDKMNDISNSNGSDMPSMEEMSGMGDATYKLVYHTLTNGDKGNADTDFVTLIDFNSNDTVEVYNPFTKQMKTNQKLTDLYSEHVQLTEIYPNISITPVLSNNQILFNLSKYILSYNLKTGKITVLKSYDSVSAKRDTTKVFGGTAFNIVDNISEADFTFENHPIAGMTVKPDGKLYVEIATNLAWISGKDDGTREGDYVNDSSKSYGYQFEETNYNTDYNSYFADMSDETNDNDEFMWVANFKGTEDLSDILNSTATVNPIFCEEHEWIHHAEKYFTKDDDSNEWNTGEAYVCVKCNLPIDEPTKPTENEYQDYEEQMAKYEKEKAVWNDAVENASHNYSVTDAQWADNHSSVTFQNLECTHCKEKGNILDVLVDDNTKEVTLSKSHTQKTESKKGDETTIYTASGKVEGNRFSVSIEVQKDENEHEHDYDCLDEESNGKCKYCDAIAPSPYSDVQDSTMWYYGIVLEATNRNLMTGYTEGEKAGMFGPDDQVTRGQIVTILYRMAGSPEVEYKQEFKDVKDGMFYSKAVTWAAKEGITTGYTGDREGEFGPNDLVTREQLATFFYRYANTPEVSGDAKPDMGGFVDTDKISDWAKDAFEWLVSVDIIRGKDMDEDGVYETLDPKGDGIRCEIAKMSVLMDELMK